MFCHLSLYQIIFSQPSKVMQNFKHSLCKVARQAFCFGLLTGFSAMDHINHFLDLVNPEGLPFDFIEEENRLDQHEMSAAGIVTFWIKLCALFRDFCQSVVSKLFPRHTACFRNFSHFLQAFITMGSQGNLVKKMLA